MRIFGESAFIRPAARDFTTVMRQTHPNHMGPLDSPYAGSGNNIIALENRIGAQGMAGHSAGTFRHTMLQALDRVSGAQHFASQLQTEAIINPDAVDAHDVTIAQAQANMALGITRNVLNRLTQGWRDLINTR